MREFKRTETSQEARPEAAAARSLDNNRVAERARRLREQQEREGIHEGERKAEARAFERTDFMRTIDAAISDMNSGHQNWNAFEQKLSERSTYDAFLRTVPKTQIAWADWQKTVASVSLKLSMIAKREGVSGMKLKVTKIKNLEQLLRL